MGRTIHKITGLVMSIPIPGFPGPYLAPIIEISNEGGEINI